MSIENGGYVPPEAKKFNEGNDPELAEAKRIVAEIGQLPDDQLTPNHWKDLHTAATLYEQAGQLQEAQNIFKRLAGNEERRVRKSINSDDGVEVHMGGITWLKALRRSGDDEAVRAAMQQLNTQLERLGEDLIVDDDLK